MRALTIASLVAAVSTGLLVSAPAPRAVAGSAFDLASVSWDNKAATGPRGGDHSALGLGNDRVAFRSVATNLVPDVSGSQIYLRELSYASTSLISQPSGPSDVGGNGPSDWPAISNDGCRVVFESDATNLVAGDGNLSTDVFVRNRCLNSMTTTLASVSSRGTQGGGQSKNADISGDGRFVVFWSSATDLVPGASIPGQVYRHDFTTGATLLVSDNGALTGQGGNRSSGCPSVSDDGTRVAFWSSATDLTGGGDPSGVWGIYLWDANGSPRVTRVSANGSGVAQDLGSNGVDSITCPAISGDGRYVAFASGSDNLVADDHNGVSDMFVKDTASGEIRRVSVSTAGAEANGPSTGRPGISRGGTSVAFSTKATNLAVQTASGGPHIVVRDWSIGKTIGLTTASSADDVPAMSTDGDGSWVASFWDASLDPHFDSGGVFLASPPFNCRRPMAYAGLDTLTSLDATVVLDGTLSTGYPGYPLTYGWTQVSGPAVSLSGADTAHPQFTPPAEGNYAFSLIVSACGQTNGPDVVNVNVIDVPPTYPVANAGPDFTAGVKGTVTLDGSASVSKTGGGLSYLWSQIQGPGVTLTASATSTPRFTPREVGRYTFRLFVNDGTHDAVPDVVSVDVVAAASMNASSVVVNGSTAGVVFCPVQPGVLRPCKVTVTLNTDVGTSARSVTVAKASTTIRGGARSRISLKWTKAGLRTLKAKGSLPVILTVTTREQGSGSTAVASRLTVRLK